MISYAILTRASRQGKSTDLYETELGGLNVLEYSVDTGVENGINSVEYLQTLDALSVFLRDQPEI